jgi:acetyl esterase/lipase
MRLSPLLLCIVIGNFCSGQDFTSMQKEADALFKAGEFKAAALAFSSLSKLTNNQPGLFFRVNFFAARGWTRANIPDSTFAALNRVASNSQMVHNHLMTLTTEPDLESLHHDRRWIEVITRMFDSITKECSVPINSSYSQEELVYGRKDGMALTMLRLRPEKVKPNGRTIIQIRSGGWGSSFYMPSVSEALPFIDRGYNVFIVFHGSEPIYTIPDAIDDIQRAVRFIRYNAKGYGFNPEKIGVIGNSAGGHLALMCALSDSANTKYSPDPVDQMSSKVRAAVSYFPVSNFLDWDSKGQIADSAFLFKEALTHVLQFRTWDARKRKFDYLTDHNQHKAILKRISPVYNVSENDAAVLLFHGDKDELVPLKQSELLARKLNEKNVPVSFHVNHGAGHGWPKSDEESVMIMKWFDDHLK